MQAACVNLSSCVLSVGKTLNSEEQEVPHTGDKKNSFTRYYQDNAFLIEVFCTCPSSQWLHDLLSQSDSTELCNAIPDIITSVTECQIDVTKLE